MRRSWWRGWAGRLVPALLLAATAAAGPSRAAHPAGVAGDADWILSLQVPSGAHKGLIPANAGKNCVPYFSNIAASGLAAATRATGDARYVQAAWDWLDWYAAHMDPNTGFITNYRPSGSLWVSTGTMDSTDGYAGSFLTAVRDAYVASGDLVRLQALWPAVGKAVAAILATDNGEWLTWAKPGYPHAFLMDNVEAYEGFRAVEWLAGDVVPDPGLRAIAGRWTANMPAAFETYWNEARGGYDIAIGYDGSRFLVDWTRLYPTVTAQVWMLRTGLVDPARASALAQRIEQHHPAWDRSGETSGTAWWPEIVEGLRFAAATERAEQGLATMVAGILATNRAWLYHVGNAGRIIQQTIGEPETVFTAGPGAYVAAVPTAFAIAGATDITTRGTISFECALDGGPWAGCPAEHTLPPLADGRHRLSVRVLDSAGRLDPTPATLPWTVDTTPPTPGILATPAEPGNATPVFAFDASDDIAPATLISFECATDAGSYVSCRSPATMLVSGTGMHTFRLRARDPAGNQSLAATFEWFADGTPPETSLLAGPSGTTAGGDAHFEFSGFDDYGEVSYQCRIGSSPFAACSSPVDLTVGEGTWTFQVRSVDEVGNPDPSPATRTWKVDRTPPTTTILEAPAAASSSQTARFVFTGADTGGGSLYYDCSLDGAPFARCVSPTTYNGLAAGPHVFEVRAVDGVGYVDPTPARHDWTIDLAAPVARFGTADGAILADAEPLLVRAVEGTATDALTGVGSVTVRFSPPEPTGGAVTVAATVTCEDATRRVCTWTAEPPAALRRYRVRAEAADRAGNLGDAGTIGVVVI